jgi:hypothetical protein
MATSEVIRRGQSDKAQGIDSDIWLGPTITTSNLKAELDKWPSEKTGSTAYNLAWLDNRTGAIKATKDFDGKWYYEDGTEVT